ncbi:hypothetical protein Dsin_003976 [Dipteronia sinensis]|uniref:3-beta hydroxysteroid dehydrogenase/isomerase domain-containing protein n=1 Tax=Dipteronia sinensis TaxID=43782 RepID=A0AAE0B9X8_9ROSI|nr:hypothetical protein Dsin_003976 [Dipteronia sinensis]
MALEKERVCVTGAGGYLASWVVKFLLSKDYLVHGTIEVIEPAVKGTFNVMKACHEAKVKRVVVVSSLAAVVMNPNWPEGQVMDETCWSDKEYCRTIKYWYSLSKTEAESEALEYGKRNGLDVVTVFTEGGELTVSSEKLQRLGWSYRPLEETLIDSVENYRKAGILN